MKIEEAIEQLEITEMMIKLSVMQEEDTEQKKVLEETWKKPLKAMDMAIGIMKQKPAVYYIDNRRKDK